MIYKRYGECAIKAYELVLTGVEPREAWQKAANELMGYNSSSAKKGCPRTSFLALLGANKKTTKNVEYILYGLEIMNKMDKEELKNMDPIKFWRDKMKMTKSYNSQIDVLFALRSKNYI